MLFASGVEWRRLDVPGVDDLLGAGVYYGAGPSEALACTGSQVVVVGGGNSAGQAVVRFSRYAKQVTLLVRGRDLGASMSQYLIDQVSAIPNVDVRVRTQVAALEADDRLRAVMVRSGDSTEPVPLPADALFICIGGAPRTDGAAGIGLVTNTCRVPGDRRRWRSRSRRQLAAAQGAAAAGDQPARRVRRRGRALRVGQTLLSGHRRGINGRGARPPAAGGGGR